MGTENRRPAEAYIPPSDVPYEFIIFRASEVKDIAVDQLPPQPSPAARNVHDDPAVMTVANPCLKFHNHLSVTLNVGLNAASSAASSTVCRTSSSESRARTASVSGHFYF